MKIINQGHEILQCPKDLGMIEKAARTCYKSESKIGCTLPEGSFCFKAESPISPTCMAAHCDQHTSHKKARELIKSGHDAMLEFADIIVKITTSRVQSQSLVRHRLCSFAQESTRYVRYGGDVEFIRPTKFVDSFDRASIAWTVAMGDAENKYMFLLKQGWLAQDARGVLPMDVKTEIVMKANIREWRHIFGLRCAKASHPQMVSLMRPLLADLHERVPVVFEDLYQKFSNQETEKDERN